MIKYQPYYFKLITACFLLITLFSCNFNSGDTPFPEKELGYLQPVTIPLQFSAEKKLTWDTTQKGTVKPVTRKLDLDALPSTPYDSNGFKPFTNKPAEVRFDFNSLPEAPFNLANLLSQPLHFKTSVLSITASAKMPAPNPQKGKPLSIADFGRLPGPNADFVGCVLKDKNGIMWLASVERVYRYDGTQIQTITVPGGPHLILGMVEDNEGRIWYIHPGGIGMIDMLAGTNSYSTKITGPLNNICKLTKTENGFIWVANTADKAVSIIDPLTGTYKKLDIKTGLSDSTAFGMLEDENQNIWISTTNGGADIINLSTGKIKYLKKVHGLISDTITAMAKDKSGQVWIAEYSGRLNAVDVKRGIIKQYDHLQGIKKNNYTLNLMCDNKGRLWKGNGFGLEIIDPEKEMTRFISEKEGILGNVIAACTLDDYKRMWVGTNKGLNIIDQNGETVHPLGTTAIVSLMEDAVGNVWVATSEGATIINAQKNSMRLLNKSNGLSNDFVQGFFKSNGKILVATNGGFNIIDPIAKTITSAGKKEGLINDTIYSLLQDKAGNTWLTGPSNGIDLIDSVTNNIRHVDIAGGLSDNNIQDIKQDKDGLIWLATFNGGVDVINLNNGNIKNLNKEPGLKDPCNKMLLPDKYGRMWIGTDKGIYVADTKQGTLTLISQKQGLSNNRILSLLGYNGSVIAGTGNKVSIITAPDTSTKEWKISVLDKSEGLIKESNSWLSDAITSKGQYLWGDNGITIINEIKPNSDVAPAPTFITGIEVMTQPQYFINKPTLTDKDTLYTNDTFYVKENIPANIGYTVAKGLTWDSVSGPFNLPVNLVIPYTSNYMHFKFVQASLSRPDTILYTYILEGVDKKWSAVTTNTITENYLNLSPGKYTFKVSSKGMDGKWSNPAAFSFTISPPWYQSWWAYTIFALLCAGILRAYIVFRSKQLKKENRILEEKVNLRTDQLQKSLEDLKSTQAQLIQSEKMASLGELTAGIAHEIQNPLNFINNFSEVNTELIAEMKEEITKGNLEEVKSLADDIASNEQKINHHGKRADGIVKGMLQHSRSGNRQKEPTNINTLADEYLRLAYHGLRAKDKSFNATMKTDFDESVGSINLITQDIGRVILNLITNAFYAVTEKKKQQPEGYEPTVTVSTKKWMGKVEIRVKDNGSGVPQKVLDKIFQPFFTTKPTGEGTGLGLSLSYDIIKAHNGELKVETKEGEGAEFIIILPQ